MRNPAVLMFSAAVFVLNTGADLRAHPPVPEPSIPAPAHFVTNTVQFRKISGAEYLSGCDFRLTGIITLVDTNRRLVVLQDSSGAVALHFASDGPLLQAGQLVTLEGNDCAPYFAVFPDYPHRPAGREIRSSFEAPLSWGEYYLTRMRGFVRPPVTGNYTFWIASDNSSQLWLSPDANPSRGRKIASVSRFAWVEPREWSKVSSQQAEPVFLRAGESYYIEALQEQSVVGNHLSVAWQGPSIERSVVDGSYLAPWRPHDSQFADATNGILREYWTNFCTAELPEFPPAGVLGSALSVKRVTAHVHGTGPFPDPLQILLGQPWLPANNFRWVQTEGLVSFVGAAGDFAVLEISDGRSVVPVRAFHWNAAMTRRVANAAVRIEGVYEGVYDQDENLVGGAIWVSASNRVSFIETLTADSSDWAGGETTRSNAALSETMQGFYGTRGVVTFNDHVFGRDLIFIQNTAAMSVEVGNRPFRNLLKVGHGADVGGKLEPGESVPVIKPFYVTELGWRSMPLPLFHPLSLPPSEKRDGRWSEFEGIVRALSGESTLSIVLRDGRAHLWLGQCDSNDAAQYLNSRVRARGVLSLSLTDSPILLVPSREFVHVEKPRKNPSQLATQTISEVLLSGIESWRAHSVRVRGLVTYRDQRSFFVQDKSGGIRVQDPLPDDFRVGDAVEVIAFPNSTAFACTLSDAHVNRVEQELQITPGTLDLAETPFPSKRGSLVSVSATLLECSTNESSQILELQESRRVFYASLPTGQGTFPGIVRGSRVQVTGVLAEEVAATSLDSAAPNGEPVLSALNILLRSPSDVKVISRPPWWTWKRTATLVGTLLTILAVSLLWVHLLRVRLERQQAAQFAFSRQVMERVEEERRRIAANLHDSLGQSLMVIKNHAILAAQSPPQGELQNRLDQISGATSNAIEEIRQITHGLRPYQLDRLGLTQALRASINQAAENSSILFASRVEEIDGVFDKDAEINVYRIVQEAVTNVVKHSDATEAAVVIKKRGATVTISIRDNGCGFDPTTPPPRAHDLGYGLNGIKERARILRGTMVMDSQPGNGTTLTVEVPLRAA